MDSLPQKNGRGNILFTTCAGDIEKTFTDVAGMRRVMAELRIPNVEDTAKLFLKAEAS